MQNVDALSDDDAVGVQHQVVRGSTGPPALPSSQSVVGRRKRFNHGGALVLAQKDIDLRKDLRSVVDSKCFCSRKRKHGSVATSCFAPFRENSEFQTLLRLRKTLASMNKLDADQKASWLISFLQQHRFLFFLNG